MKNKIKKNKDGFTLVEILIAISIFLAIIGALTLFVINIFNYNSYIGARLTTADINRTALRKMTTEIRSASISSNGAYPIDTASPTSFSFYVDINNDGLKEKIRYFISGTTLKRGILKPTGNPPVYNSPNEIVTDFVKNLTNTSSVFNYYDKNYDGTTAPLSTPININLVRLVKITITSDANPNRAPGADTLTTQISIRNLKDNI